MNEAAIKSLLYTDYPQELIDALIDNYKNAILQFKKETWKYFGNDCGQFNEMFFRILELKLTGQYTAIKNKLPIFNEKILTDWENNSQTTNESYRLIMPRVLYSMYCIRNKRGMIHPNGIIPSKTDATLLVYNMKWLICELLRLTSNNNIDQTMSLIEDIMAKESSIIWKYEDTLKILEPSINIKHKILILLYYKNKQTLDELFINSDYSNKSIFKKNINELKKTAYLTELNNQYIISPKGISFIEKEYYK